MKGVWRSARYWLDRHTGWRWDAVLTEPGDALAEGRAAHAIENAKVGAWFTYCCHLDLERIETQEQAEQIRREHAECDGSSGWPWRVWPTRREALEDLLKSSDGEEAEEIKAMLQTEES